MYKTAGTEEEKGLEHGMCEQMEHAGHISESRVVHTLHRFVVCASESHHHECDLRNCRERKDSLDIDLSARHYRCIESSDCSNDSNESERIGHDAEHREESSHKIYTGNNHGSSVNECRHGRRALHRIGKPDVQRHHGRFTHTSDKDENHRPCQNRTAHESRTYCRGKNASGV